LGDRSALPALIQALKDEYQSVRSSAAEALGQLGDKSALLALKAALASEKDEEVLSRLKEAIEKLEAL